MYIATFVLIVDRKYYEVYLYVLVLTYHCQ